MAKKFAELRARMSPQAQARAEAKAVKAALMRFFEGVDLHHHGT